MAFSIQMMVQGVASKVAGFAPPKSPVPAAWSKRAAPEKLLTFARTALTVGFSFSFLLGRMLLALVCLHLLAG